MGAALQVRAWWRDAVQTRVRPHQKDLPCRRVYVGGNIFRVEDAVQILRVLDRAHRPNVST